MSPDQRGLGEGAESGLCISSFNEAAVTPRNLELRISQSLPAQHKKKPPRHAGQGLEPEAAVEVHR